MKRSDVLILQYNKNQAAPDILKELYFIWLKSISSCSSYPIFIYPPFSQPYLLPCFLNQMHNHEIIKIKIWKKIVSLEEIRIVLI